MSYHVISYYVKVGELLVGAVELGEREAAPADGQLDLREAQDVVMKAYKQQ